MLEDAGDAVPSVLRRLQLASASARGFCTLRAQCEQKKHPTSGDSFLIIAQNCPRLHRNRFCRDCPCSGVHSPSFERSS
jgi:hypothetical protein